MSNKYKYILIFGLVVIVDGSRADDAEPGAQAGKLSKALSRCASLFFRLNIDRFGDARRI